MKMHSINVQLHIVWVMLLAGVLSLCACKGAPDESDTLLIYDINRDKTKLIANEYKLNMDYSGDSDDTADVIGQCLNRMITGPDEPDQVGAIGIDAGAVTYYLEQNVVTVNFGAVYYDATTTVRVLRRAAIVRTLCQIDGIEGVSITVDHAAVMDSDGQPIGVMTEESFLENDEAKINAYEKSELHLFFANAEGDLLKEYVESTVHSSNIALERLVVDSIIAGPKEGSQSYPTVNPDCKVLNVTSKDGICYVNLSSDFLTKTTNVRDDVVIYSIVDSLTQLPNINKVQFMVDGETEVSMGSIYLSSPFERNLDLVK